MSREIVNGENIYLKSEQTSIIKTVFEMKALTNSYLVWGLNIKLV